MTNTSFFDARGVGSVYACQRVEPRQRLARVLSHWINRCLQHELRHTMTTTSARRRRQFHRLWRTDHPQRRRQRQSTVRHTCVNQMLATCTAHVPVFAAVAACSYSAECSSQRVSIGAACHRPRTTTCQRRCHHTISTTHTPWLTLNNHIKCCTYPDLSARNATTSSVRPSWRKLAPTSFWLAVGTGVSVSFDDDSTNMFF